MLDQKDIELLQGVMESAVDKRLTESETSILNKMDKRLAETETSILIKVDKKLAETETSISNKMDKKLTESENLILEEMDRTRKILEDKIAQVQKNVDELNSYFVSQGWNMIIQRCC